MQTSFLNHGEFWPLNVSFPRPNIGKKKQNDSYERALSLGKTFYPHLESTCNLTLGFKCCNNINDKFNGKE